MCSIQIKNLLYIIVMGIASSKQTVIPKKKEKTYAPVSVKEEKEKNNYLIIRIRSQKFMIFMKWHFYYALAEYHNKIHMLL